MSRLGGVFRPGIRRAVQAAFLVAFVGLLLAARPTGSDRASRWLTLWFDLDPLVVLATWLTTHTLLATWLWAAGTVAVTLVLGRVFCGWCCPLGTIHAAAGWVCDKLKWNRRRADHFSPWQRMKYYLLAGTLLMAALGSHWVTIFDPLVLLYRSATTGLLPGFQWAVEESSTAVYKADPGIGPARLTALTEPAYKAIRDRAFVVQHQAFLGGGVLLGLFLLTVGLNAYRRRFWCRYLCPLGGLLGLLAWRPLLRRQTEESCNACDLCSHGCQGAAGDRGGKGWRASECFVCLTCTSGCRRESMSFTAAAPWNARPPVERIDLSKRALFGAAIGGVAALAAFRATPQARGNVFNARLLRPPGALPESDFLARCLSCGLCMKVCPTGGLQPTWAEAGLEGIWTPRLVPHLGQCEYNCNLCGQVCPTQAIQPLSVEEKQKVRIGLASFDVTRCIPYAYDRECMVCEEHCPIPDKAIYFVEVEVTERGGGTKKVKRPHVDPEKCIGCGICENVCPFRDRPGIHVTSANETRHPGNQPILPADMPY